MSTLDGARLGLIVGSMKSGTTSLFEYLVQHPEISACSEKEPGYFSHDDRFSRGESWYRSLWPDSAPGDGVLIEASTHYTKSHRHPQNLDRIAGVEDRLGSLRMLYIMRDPIERMVSHYKHLVRIGIEPMPPTPTLRVTDAMIAVGSYAAEIGPYIERFGRDRVCLLAFESLRHEPQRVLGDICRFLAVDPAFAFSGLEATHNPGLTDGAAWRLAQAIPGARLAAKALPQGLKAAARKSTAKPTVLDNLEVTEEDRRTIHQALDADLRRLEAEFGFDTSLWRQWHANQS